MSYYDSCNIQLRALTSNAETPCICIMKEKSQQGGVLFIVFGLTQYTFVKSYIFFMLQFFHTIVHVKENKFIHNIYRWTLFLRDSVFCIYIFSFSSYITYMNLTSYCIESYTEFRPLLIHPAYNILLCLSIKLDFLRVKIFKNFLTVSLCFFNWRHVILFYRYLTKPKILVSD